MQVVWFKKDLRLADHRPLAKAAAQGPVICLYIYEPELYEAPDFDSMHFHFISQSLRELGESLRAAGGSLVTRLGEATQVLQELFEEVPFRSLWAHEETGNDLTFQRDRRVRRWATDNGVKFVEIPQTGVVRRLSDRDGWSKVWKERMSAPLTSTVKRLECPEIRSAGLLEAGLFGLKESLRPEVLPGGEQVAMETLKSFLKERGESYSKELSSPVTAFHSCSRLSPYLTYGNISMRQVVQLTRAAKKTARGKWRRSLNSFLGRLHWHCHFIQKLESEPEIEYQNMNRAYDGLREDEFDEEKFSLWKEGRTGYPMVDACMRALHKGGWINFRMRAMLVSFCCHHLWLHWREPSLYLARQFVDYEPGIHYSQFQMQAGTTGINAIRIYSPIKQVSDLDQKGVFLRRYLPELEGVPDKYLPAPHTMPKEVQEKCGCVIGKDYPQPVVDHKTAYGQAKKRLYTHKARPEVKAASKAVYEKHGSRRGGGG